MLAVPALLTLASCASAPKHTATIPQDHFAEIQRPGIPLVMNDRVQDWINYFEGPGREHFERYLRRSGKYIPMMRRVLRSEGMPDDLVYLSMIESGFNPHAYSSARATGAWQFIYQTGLRYGLKVDSWVDERRDPEKSTVAAAKYLKDLYDRYNNWYLAAAGYNAGEGKIDRAIQKYDTEDFWELSEERYLRAETKDYVPKLIAAALIAKNPEKYGFRNVQYEEPIPFDEVSIKDPIDLRVAAKSAGVTYGEIKALNPELLHWVTPLDYKEYSIKVPAGTADRFKGRYDGLTAEERLGGEKLEVEETTSIERLAKKRDVPPLLLAAANGLSPSDSVKAGQSIFLPMDPPEGESFYEKVYERTRHGGRAIAYKVHRGDSIATISKKTGIRVALLKKYNSHVDWSNIHKGQKLKLYASAGRGRGETRAVRRAGRRHSREARLAGRGGHHGQGKIAMASMSMTGGDVEPARPHVSKASKKATLRKSRTRSSARVARRYGITRKAGKVSRTQIRAGQKPKTSTPQSASAEGTNSPSM